MIRVLFYVAVVFLLAAAFVWLAERPGVLLITWQGYEIRASLMVAAVGVATIVALIAAVGALIRAVVRSPQAFGEFIGARRRDRGYRALSRGMIAVGAGDTRAAQRAAQESRTLLGGKEPLVLLLSAQAAQIAGDGAEARSAFEALTQSPETRVLGLHGLFVEARRQGEHGAARHFAEEATRLAPRIGWAGTALFEYQAQAGDWAGALATLAANADAGAVDRERAKRLRAVLLTAQAMEREGGEPDEARLLATEANRLAPELVPAATTAARLLTRLGDTRRASRVLETAWKAQPHPEIADAYAVVRPGDSVRDRLKRMRRLTELRANHPEGAMALARAAIDARDWQGARNALGGPIRTNPGERVCLLMAEIEEGENGDQGRVRTWLTRALSAPRDPVWTADGQVFPRWAPVSPVTGRVDAFEWKVVAERAPGRAVEIEALRERTEEPAPVVAVAATPLPQESPAPPPAPGAPPPQPEPPRGAKARQRESMPLVPDDPGPPRRADEDERYRIF